MGMQWDEACHDNRQVLSFGLRLPHLTCWILRIRCECVGELLSRIVEAWSDRLFRIHVIQPTTIQCSMMKFAFSRT